MNGTDQFFPGVFDPDGRPWDRYAKSRSDYERALESALKLALLTHRYLIVPAGYFFDSPPLQRIFLKYKGDSNEARCFRVLMRNLIRISPNVTQDVKTLNDWKAMLTAWASGEGKQRRGSVYLNAVPHNVAIELQRSAEPDLLTAQMREAVRGYWNVDLNDFLRVCSDLRLETIPRGDFPFDSLIRERLLTRRESFGELNELTLKKLEAIANSCLKTDQRLSRSLINNAVSCEELGVKPYDVLTRQEYDLISPVLGHYHHLAFAEAFNLYGAITRRNPDMAASAKTMLRKEFEDVAGQIATTSKSGWTTWPLSATKFENLYHLRMTRTDFWDYLNPVLDATAAADTEEYLTALSRYHRHVAGVLSFHFRSADPGELAAALAESVYEESFGKLAGKTVKYSFAVFRDFPRNLRQELQVDCMFRSLRSEVEVRKS